MQQQIRGPRNCVAAFQIGASTSLTCVGDQRGEGNALGNLGTAYNDLGDYHGAIKYQEKRLAIARAMGD